MGSVFATLSEINVNDKVEKKHNLKYLSWAYAWGEVKKLYPAAFYTIYENADGWNYFTDGKTCWVKTGVTIEGLEHIEYLPVLDYKNKSIPLDAITSYDVNKTIQRSLTKAIARHGLGLYIYAGEDLPEEPTAAADDKPPAKPQKTAPTQKKEPPKAEPENGKPLEFTIDVDGDAHYICERCGAEIESEYIAQGTLNAYGVQLCKACGINEKKRKANIEKARKEAGE